MQPALYLKTQVLPGHRIEIEDSNLSEGETVDIFIVTSPKTEQNQSSVIDIIEEIRSHRTSFKTVEEIDQYIQQERSSWDN